MEWLELRWLPLYNLDPHSGPRPVRRGPASTTLVGIFLVCRLFLLRDQTRRVSTSKEGTHTTHNTETHTHLQNTRPMASKVHPCA